jgi:hypothetical protein
MRCMQAYRPITSISQPGLLSGLKAGLKTACHANPEIDLALVRGLAAHSQQPLW